MPSASSAAASGGGGGLSGGVMLVLYVSLMGALLAAFLVLRKRFRAAEEEKPAAGRAANRAQAQPAAAAAGGRRAAGGRQARGALDRMRRNAAAADEADEPEEDAHAEAEDAPLDRAARLERERAAAQAARAAVREAQEAAQAVKQKKADKYAEKHAAREAEREAQEAELQRAEAERAAAQAKADAAEMDEWAGMFEVTGSGSAAAEDGAEGEGLLDKFVEHIQTRKVVVLDEMAARFKIKTQDVISRIQTLEASGRLQGVLDDRGKYLFLTEDELDGMARFLARRGRASIQDIVAEANKIIDLSAAATGAQMDEGAGARLVLDDEEDDKAAA